MQIELYIRQTPGTSPGTLDKLYTYVVAVLPKELLELANLRPTDRLSRRVEGTKVFLKYDPDGYLYQGGKIGINEDLLPFPLNYKDDTSIMVDYTIVGDELMFEIPESILVIRRGFDLVRTLKGFGGIAV